MKVLRVLHVASGIELELMVDLEPDGFEFEPPEGYEDNCDTEDETVYCRSCEYEMDLYKLSHDYLEDEETKKVISTPQKDLPLLINSLKYEGSKEKLKERLQEGA